MIARSAGRVTRTFGTNLVATLPLARVGDGVRVATARGDLRGEVVALDDGRVAIAPFGAIDGIALGDAVVCDPDALATPCGVHALGRAFDAAGRALDGRPDPPLVHRAHRRIAPLPGERAPVVTPLWTGVAAIDALLTIGRGARVGIFGPPGAGKTSLLETIVTGARVDAVVLALVGERGREAHAWCARLDRRFTIVCATSDRSAAERARAASVAMTHAACLRARGLHVLLVVDSLARYAAALRERCVALGEPAGRGGYPPTVWHELARLLERAGPLRAGSITVVATVLGDGDDPREPLADAARSFLDGHVILDARLAAAGRFPAIDVLASASRTMAAVVTTAHARAAARVRSALARLAATADARALGLDAGNGAGLRAALDAESAIEALVRRREPAAAAATLALLDALAAGLDDD